MDEGDGGGGAEAEVEFEDVEGVLWVAENMGRVAEVCEEGLCAVCGAKEACAV